MYENYQTELSNLRHETMVLEHKYQKMAENFEGRLKDLGKSLESSEDDRFHLINNEKITKFRESFTKFFEKISMKKNNFFYLLICIFIGI